MTKPLLFGKSALITGACKGAGKKIAYMLAKAGATVILSYHTSGKHNAQAIANKINCSGGKAVAINANLNSTEAVSKLVKQIEEYAGGVDILVNYADTAVPNIAYMYTEVSMQQEEKPYDGSVISAMEAIIPLMKKKHYGRIINIASSVQQDTIHSTGNFTLAANSMLNFTYYYASLLAQYGITINTITPEVYDIANDVACNKNGPPNAQQDIADMTLLLACNGYVSGQTINIGQYTQAS